MKARRISIEVNIEGKPDRLPYPKNAPIPREGEWILSPINTGYVLEVVMVSYQYGFNGDTHITIQTINHPEIKLEKQ